MSRNWTIALRDAASPPTPDDVSSVITSYFGGMGIMTTSEDGRTRYVVLPGRYSPMRPGEPDEPTERWIEIFASLTIEGWIVVTTRQADPLTNAVADGLARVIAGRFGAELTL